MESMGINYPALTLRRDRAHARCWILVQGQRICQRVVHWRAVLRQPANVSILSNDTPARITHDIIEIFYIRISILILFIRIISLRRDV